MAGIRVTLKSGEPIEITHGGRPHDPWLATHVRAGEIEVPGALAPVRCDTGAGIAVYVEPNIWVRHDLTAGE